MHQEEQPKLLRCKRCGELFWRLVEGKVTLTFNDCLHEAEREELRDESE